jgi:small-conductance mechanosensitive channel
VAAIRALGIGARVLSWAVLLLVALEWAFHRDIWPIITALGAGGIALALAVQQILADLLAAIAIVFDKPFDVGDTISIDAISGTVEHVGLKTTRLRSVNGEQIVLSNADVLRARVHNWRRMSERRVVATVDASPATSPDGLARIPGIVERAVAAQANGRFQRCHLAQITDAGYRFEYVFTVLDREYAAMTAVQHAVNLELVRRFAAERIEFARPLRQV